MRTARTKLEAARAAMREGENLEARWLAEQAKLDALLEGKGAMRDEIYDDVVSRL